ncbi:VanZ like family protein [Natranaerofaba carboxydovora]|nr:VanZ like family protein [Natranaerofaba carboxydovora]
MFINYHFQQKQITTGGIHIPPTEEEFRVVTYQIVPFNFILDWIYAYNRSGYDWFFWNSIRLSLYNLIMLLPLGVYLPVLLNVKSIKKISLYIALTSLTIEIYQIILSYFGVVLARTANVDDIILNTIGGIIGYCIYRIALSQWIHKFVID